MIENQPFAMDNIIFEDTVTKVQTGQALVFKGTLNGSYQGTSRYFGTGICMERTDRVKLEILEFKTRLAKQNYQQVLFTIPDRDPTCGISSWVRFELFN